MSEERLDDVMFWKAKWISDTDMLEDERNGLEAKAAMLEADLAAARFAEREWHDKAQDKIAECEQLEAENERLRELCLTNADNMLLVGEKYGVLQAENQVLREKVEAVEAFLDSVGDGSIRPFKLLKGVRAALHQQGDTR